MPDDKKSKNKKSNGCKKLFKKDKTPSVPLSKILDFAADYRPLMAFGSIFAIFNGVSYPAFSLLMGNLLNLFFVPQDPEVLQTEVQKIAIIFLCVGIGSALFGYLSHMMWITVGEKVIVRIRARYFEALLAQEAGYFDQKQSGELVSTLSANTALILAGISEKMSLLMFYISQGVSSIAISLYLGWKMTLVMLAMSPALIASGALEGYLLTSAAKRASKQAASASTVAQEAISGIKTVLSFVAERFVIARHDEVLSKAYNSGKKRAHIRGLGYAFSNLFVFAVMALGFWYGGQLIISGENAPGDVIGVFFAILLGAMGFGQVLQTLPDIAKARGAAVAVFEVIEKKPQIVSGDVKNMSDGRIEMRDVKFSYPSRPDALILNSLNFTSDPGQQIALVGSSGGGKSTVIQLLERFYDVSEGTVMIDGIDTREYDLSYLRTNIGLVSQEPTLFSGTIGENIRYGKPDSTEEEMIHAAMQANAHNFISALPLGYNTPVGERGTQLSGGQKQRIAIARAVLKNPKILLLDEATSALDNESERLVQEALDKLMKGRTTIIIAHRLTTIQNAHKICFMQGGRIIEQGTHEELLAMNGAYTGLVERHKQNHKEKN
jgi:ATP-binding cassette subfamily B (MDR/TAP) protein 1